jgi:hypothetical protein
MKHYVPETASDFGLFLIFISSLVPSISGVAAVLLPMTVLAAGWELVLDRAATMSAPSHLKKGPSNVALGRCQGVLLICTLLLILPRLHSS